MSDSKPSTPVPGRVAQALAESLLGLDPDPKDAALVALAREFADTIDALTLEGKGKSLGVLGPSLLKCLIELGATPAARAAVRGGATPDDSPESELEKLRKRRRARQN